MTYYDREANIVYIALKETDIARTVEHDWGLVDLDEDEQPIGIEYWSASRHLPADLLEALPAPPARGIVVERQTA